MSFLAIFLITSVVFFIGDFVWLYCVMNTFFISKITHLMYITPRGFEINYLSAIAAYIILALGLSYFVIFPCLNMCSYKELLIKGSLFGFCMYGVYELTNYATLASWPVSFLCVDLVWGTVWSGVVSVITTFLIR